MGWWKVDGTGSVIGDVPLDALTEAVTAVVAAYEAEFKRRPTKSDWEALLSTVLGSEEPEQRVADDGIVRAVRVDIG